eukprot:gene4846-5314_t
MSVEGSNNDPSFEEESAVIATKCRGRQIDVQRLHYSVPIGTQADSKKLILKDLTFSLLPGSLCALMGPSGSGKSTLLDLLADRKFQGEWSGEILFNGGSRSKWFQRDSAYILQDDLHIPTLTVRETVLFSAQVRLPEGTSLDVIEQRVNMLLDLMGLNSIQHSYVGGQKIRGISGGQMKRLSIAVEIVSLPDCIFLDEPTSGLDSLMALEVMQTVRKLADQNRTCVSTIHQPSPQVFALFDSLVLIVEGRLIYYGPTRRAVGYFTSLGFNCEIGENPAEFVIEVSQGMLASSSFGSMTALQLVECYNNSELRREVDQPCQVRASEDNSSQTGPTSSMPFHHRHRLHATTKWTQFKHILKRQCTAIVRNRQEIIAQLAKNALVGGLIGTIFFNQVEVTLPLFDMFGVPQAEVNNISALLFFGMMYTMVSNVESIPQLCSLHRIFQREVLAFAYSVSPYWLANSLSVIPLQVVGFVFFAIPTYFLCSFPLEWDYFWYFSSLLLIASLSSYYLAMALAAWTNDERMSFILYPLSFLFFSLFAGYAIPVDDVPAMWSWAPYVSYIRWAFQGTMVNQWSDYSSPEDNDGYPSVLEMFGFDGYDKYNSYWILSIVVVFNVLLAYLAMRPPRKNLKKLALCDLLNGTKDKLAESQAVGVNPLLDRSNLSEKLMDSVTIERPPPPDPVLRDLPGTSTGSMMVPGSGVELAFLRITYDFGSLSILKESEGQDLRAISAYVTQDNVFLPCLTVEETLAFSAALRLPEQWDQGKKALRVKEIMSILRLDEISHSLVGDEERRGISGGQKKRLAIGIEIIHLPNLIFLDEPTTGLDSSMAYEVISIVQGLTQFNRTILCTIHQPSVRTFHLFHNLLLLAEGRLVFAGPVTEAARYFQGSPCNFICAADINPADFLIEVVSGMASRSAGAEKLTNADLDALFARSMQGQSLSTMLAGVEAEDQAKSGVLSPSKRSRAIASRWGTATTSLGHQVSVLVRRRVLQRVRTPSLLLATSLRYMFIALFYGSVFYALPTGTDTSCYSNRLCILFFTLLLVLMGHQEDIPALLEDRMLFYRERAASAYCTFAYWLTNVIVVLPFSAINVTCYSIILYCLTGLRKEWSAFFCFLYIVLVTDWIGCMVCQMVSYVSASAEIAMSFFPVALFFAMAFEGFIVYLPQFPKWLQWADNLSYMRFSFQAVVVNEFSGNSELPLEEIYLSNLGFQELDAWQCGAILWAFVVIHTVLSYLLLAYLDFEKR